MKYTSETDHELVYAHEGDAGMDLCVKKKVSLTEQFQMVGTGIAVEIPKGCMGLIVPRSSSGKLGIELANTVGIIDHQYRGELIMMLRSSSTKMVTLQAGQKVAQLIILPITSVKPVKVDELKSTTRDKNGFGSTGK